MRRRSYYYQLTLVVALLFAFCLPVLLSGCAALGGKDDSPELKQQKTYMQARKEFALTAKKYNEYYDKADAATQAKWKKDIDPWFLKVDKALDAWKLAIDQGWDPSAQEEKYLDLKSDLLILLVDVFGIKEE